MAGGDLNGDGYSDFLSATDTTLGLGTDRIRCKIYIFNGGEILSTTPSQIITYDSLCKSPTFCIADFNKDGYGDLAVGDRGGIGVYSEKGQVNIHYGTGIDLPNTPDLVIGGYGSATATNFGQALSSGDINGDGVDDLIVGAPDYGELNARGRVYVYYGDTLGLHTWPDIIMNGRPEAGYWENFGNATSADDLNGDGFDDLIVGAYNNCGNSFSAGKVYYYYSEGASIDTIPDGWIYGEGYEQQVSIFGLSLVQSDTIGFASLGWFGTPIWNNPSGSIGEGKCYLVPGDTTGELTPLWTITGEDTGLGGWSSRAGYSDGDKLGDLLSGASRAYSCRGKVYLWLRRPIMRNIPDAYIIGRYPSGAYRGDVLGATVAPAGDVDNCGKDEFLISNWYADTGHMIWLCKYTGPDANAVAGEPVNIEQLAINNVLQNSPNPFNHETTIKYQVPPSGKISLKVYNISGQLVKTLVDEETSPFNPSPRGEGRVGSVVWKGCDDRGQRVSNGVYVYRLQSASQCLTRKMILLK
jgi:hypothetical protein